MRDIARLLLLSVFGSLAVLPPVGAQDNIYGGYGPGLAAAEDGRADGRWFADEPTVTRAVLTLCCPTVSIDACTVEDARPLPDRYSLAIERIGTIDDVPLILFRYRRETLFQDPAFAGVDRERQSYFPCRASRVLLVRAAADDQYEIVWEGHQVENAYRLADVALHHRDEGHILAFTYCVIGSGGCWQELFIKTANTAWRPLEKDGSWARVYADMPDGYSLHKSPAIDFETMTWERSMATAEDPNCCASGTIKMKLSIRAGRLSIVSHEYVRREPAGG